MSICIVTTKIGEAGFTPLNNLIQAISGERTPIIVITSKNFKMYASDMNKKEDIIIEGTGYKIRTNKFVVKIIDFIVNQVVIAYKLIKYMNEYDIVLFFIGCEKMVLPIYLSKKILNKKTYILLAGSDYLVELNRSKILYYVLKNISNLIRCIVDSIIVYSPNLIKEWNLEKYRYKIVFGYEHILDKINLREVNDISNREYIGYIGRLNIEKGIVNFIKMTELAKNLELRFLIGGDGELREEIISYITKNKLEKKVNYVGWIKKSDLYIYLNKIKLLIIPSYTEGLPNILLEGLACGTPILVTSVGAPKDIICPNKTGFLIETNDPQTLFEKVLELLSNVSKLKKVKTLGKKYVLKKFDHEYVRKRWSKILSD